VALYPIATSGQVIALTTGGLYNFFLDTEFPNKFSDRFPTNGLLFCRLSELGSQYSGK
jgi:hypothetical protein